LYKETSMSKIVDEVLAANHTYASDFGDKGQLPMPPGRHFAILTCMDARLDPAKYAGLAEGDAHVIRNAGGRASDDAIRSLVISYKLLGTREWFVIHHTDCGMQTFTDDVMRKLLRSSLKTASVDASGWHDAGGGGGGAPGRPPPGGRHPPPAQNRGAGGWPPAAPRRYRVRPASVAAGTLISLPLFTS
jgi:carbonic anhydrase